MSDLRDKMRAALTQGGAPQDIVQIADDVLAQHEPQPETPQQRSRGATEETQHERASTQQSPPKAKAKTHAARAKIAKRTMRGKQR